MRTIANIFVAFCIENWMIKMIMISTTCAFFFLVYLVCDVLFLLLKYKGWEDEPEEMTSRKTKGEIKGQTRILIFFNADYVDIQVLACF